MRESPFGFQYSWADLKPIRPLATIVLIAQVFGALIGVIFASHSQFFWRLWFGGAITTFPAFIVGAFVQSHLKPGSISENKIMVRRLGLIAAILSLAALFMPELEFNGNF
jgi:peptidoglycan/LPS O-acetylase OafA/YrhL